MLTILARLTHSKELLRLASMKISSDSTNFYPDFDSAVPLNPWSKAGRYLTHHFTKQIYLYYQVSLGGYMVARAKKVLGKLVEKELTTAFKDLKC